MNCFRQQRSVNWKLPASLSACFINVYKTMSTRRQALQLYSGFLHKGKFKTFSSIMKQSYLKLSFDRIVKIYLWGRRNCYWLTLAPRAYFIRTKIPVCIYKISIEMKQHFLEFLEKGTPQIFENFSSGITVLFGFPLRISGFFSNMLHISEL